jgi:LysM repeat protein
MKENSLTHRLICLCFYPLFIILILACQTIDAAPQRRYAYDEDNTQTTREMRDSIDNIRHEVENHETEIRMSQERVDNLESTIASLRQQLLDANQANKELVKGSSNSVEGRITALETANKGLVADLQKFKTHANDSSTALAQYKDRVAELEKIINSQSQNIDKLQSAVRLMSEALQVQVKETSLTDASIPSSDKSYKVKPGDSLEKIARNNGTTLRALREANNLTNDRIIVGQTLKLP